MLLMRLVLCSERRWSVRAAVEEPRASNRKRERPWGHRKRTKSAL